MVLSTTDNTGLPDDFTSLLAPLDSTTQSQEGTAHHHKDTSSPTPPPPYQNQQQHQQQLASSNNTPSAGAPGLNLLPRNKLQTGVVIPSRKNKPFLFTSSSSSAKLSSASTTHTTPRGASSSSNTSLASSLAPRKPRTTGTDSSEEMPPPPVPSSRASSIDKAKQPKARARATSSSSSSTSSTGTEHPSTSQIDQGQHKERHQKRNKDIPASRSLHSSPPLPGVRSHLEEDRAPIAQHDSHLEPYNDHNEQHWASDYAGGYALDPAQALYEDVGGNSQLERELEGETVMGGRGQNLKRQRDGRDEDGLAAFKGSSKAKFSKHKNDDHLPQDTDQYPHFSFDHDDIYDDAAFATHEEHEDYESPIQDRQAGFGRIRRVPTPRARSESRAEQDDSNEMASDPMDQEADERSLLGYDRGLEANEEYHQHGYDRYQSQIGSGVQDHELPTAAPPDPLASVANHFPGPLPYLQHALARLEAAKSESERAEMVERYQKMSHDEWVAAGEDIAKRFEGLMGKVVGIVVRRMAKTSELTADVDAHQQKLNAHRARLDATHRNVNDWASRFFGGFSQTKEE